MIRAVLIDLDGVIRRWAPWEPSADSPVTNDELRAVAFDADDLQEVVTGGITDEQWREHIASRLEREHGPAARRTVEEWSSGIGDVDTDVLELVRALRRVVPVALISNATTRLESDLGHLGLLDELDVIVNSSRVGIAKPDEGIFRHAADAVGAALDECLFIDDTAGHVEAAAKLGLRTIHFTDPARLRTALASYGLIAGERLELLIRSARPDESSVLAELHYRTEVDAYSSIFPSDAPGPTLDERKADWSAKLRQWQAFVAVVDNRVVGVALVGEDVFEPGAGHLLRFCVDPEFQRRGIGARLYQAGITYLSELGFETATLWVLERNQRARRWYERLGWQPTGERKPVFAPAGIDDLRYRLTSI